MLKWLLAVVAMATPVFGQGHPTAYEAMRTMGTQLNRDFVDRVISVTGANGNPQPETWRILIDDPKARGGVREVEVSSGRIASERTPLRASVENSLGAKIDTAKLNLDSSGAFTVAQQTAARSHVSFTTVDYTLRVDDRDNPIWMITLHRSDGEPTGTIYIGANHGTITRTEGLFTGSDRTAVVDEEGVEPNPDAEQGDDNDADSEKRGIKNAFRQAGDDVKRTFYKVRRSFIDFFKDK